MSRDEFGICFINFYAIMMFIFCGAGNFPNEQKHKQTNNQTEEGNLIHRTKITTLNIS